MVVGWIGPTDKKYRNFCKVECKGISNVMLKAEPGSGRCRSQSGWSQVTAQTYDNIAHKHMLRERQLMVPVGWKRGVPLPISLHQQEKHASTLAISLILGQPSAPACNWWARPSTDGPSLFTGPNQTAEWIENTSLQSLALQEVHQHNILCNIDCKTSQASPTGMMHHRPPPCLWPQSVHRPTWCTKGSAHLERSYVHCYYVCDNRGT